MPIVQVTVADGTLPIEADDRYVFDVPDIGEGSFENVGESLAKATKTLGAFIQDTCSQVYSAMTEAVRTVKPSGAEVSFAIAVGGEAGFPFVAKGTAEGSIRITLKWDFERRPPGGGRDGEAGNGDDAEASGPGRGEG
jgi:hypothetical protein